jgi:RNA polymerase sigma factor (sigma-70 family)
MELSAPFTRALLAGFGSAYTDLLRLTTRSTGCREDARELVHDTWLRLAEHDLHARDGHAVTEEPGAAQAPREVAAYLATMAQNLALDHLRRNQRLAQHRRAEAQHAAWAPVYTPDVAETAMYRQALAVLEQALASLPERSRCAFWAHRLHGADQATIAAQWGVSINTVERDLILARACIADALQRWQGMPATSPPSRPGRRRSLGALLSLAGMGMGGALAWQQWQGYRHSHVQWQATLATPRGQGRRNTLPDGSTLQLDAMSQASVHYYATRRSVQLIQGAAYFAVVRDVERPFTVQADGVCVSVLGTRFGVEMDTQGGQRSVQVQVESGQVRVEAPGMPAHTLQAGQGLRVARNGVAQARSGPAALWREGVLEFDHATLGEALARLSRYAPLDLRATPEAGRLALSGQVHIAQARAWLEALPRAMPVRLQWPQEGGVLVALR